MSGNSVLLETVSASLLGITIISELVEFNYSSFPCTKCLIATHLHHFYQLDVILSGHVTVKVEGKKALSGSAGDGWLIPPLLRHGYESRKSFRQVSFKFHLVPQCWELFGKQFQRRRLSRELIVAAEAVERYRSNSRLAVPQAVAVATLCLIEFLDQNKPTPAHVDNLDLFRCTLWPLLEQIVNTPHAGWTVGRMAEACHLSEDYSSKRFHQVVGQTPQRYVIENRMRSTAAELLAEPARPIKDIAEKANYATVHAFSRAFRQVMGVAPAAYRRAGRAL